MKIIIMKINNRLWRKKDKTYERIKLMSYILGGKFLTIFIIT